MLWVRWSFGGSSGKETPLGYSRSTRGWSCPSDADRFLLDPFNLVVQSQVLLEPPREQSAGTRASESDSIWVKGHLHRHQQNPRFKSLGGAFHATFHFSPSLRTWRPLPHLTDTPDLRGAQVRPTPFPNSACLPWLFSLWLLLHR